MMSINILIGSLTNIIAQHILLWRNHLAKRIGSTFYYQISPFHRTQYIYISCYKYANLSFRNEFYKNDTELSKELRQMKMKNYTLKITWRIIRKCLPYNYNSRKCYLSLNKKLEIALYEGENLLNKKTDLISKCRHQNKFMLWHHGSKDWKWSHF